MTRARLLLGAALLLCCPNRCSVAAAAPAPEPCTAWSHLASPSAQGTTWTSRIVCAASPGARTRVAFAYPLPRGTRSMAPSQTLELSRGVPVAISLPEGARGLVEVVLFTPARRTDQGVGLTPPLLVQEAPQLVGFDDGHVLFTPHAMLEAQRGHRGTTLIGAPHRAPAPGAVDAFRDAGARGEVLVVRTTSLLRERGGLDGSVQTRTAHFRATYIALAVVTLLGAFVLARMYRRYVSDAELEEAEAIVRADLESERFSSGARVG